MSVFQKKILTGCLIAVFGLILIPMSASAKLSDAGTTLGGIEKSIGLESNVYTLTQTIIATVLAIVGTIFLILMVFAGVIWMTAAGNEQRTEKAKSIIIMAVVGMAVTASAWAITNFVLARFGGVDCASQKTEATCAPASICEWKERTCQKKASTEEQAADESLRSDEISQEASLERGYVPEEGEE